MDKKSVKRVVLFTGLLLCVIGGSLLFLRGWARTVRTQDEEMLGQLILMQPKTTAEYVSVMRGKSADKREKAVSDWLQSRRKIQLYGRLCGGLSGSRRISSGSDFRIRDTGPASGYFDFVSEKEAEQPGAGAVCTQR